MIRLEITADNPSDLQQHLAFLADAFLPKASTPKFDAERYELLKRDAEARSRGENTDGSPRRETVMVDTPTADPSPPIAEPVGDVTKIEPVKKRQGRPRKEPVTIEGTAVEVQPEGPKYELDDLRRRVKEIGEAGMKAGKDMPAVMVLLKSWFGDLGITHVKELPAEKYGLFMQQSEDLLKKAAA